MYCYHCGALISEKSNFCSKCGNDQRNQDDRNKPIQNLPNNNRSTVKVDLLKGKKSILAREIIVNVRIVLFCVLILLLSYLSIRYMYYDSSGFAYSEAARGELTEGVPWKLLNHKSTLDWKAEKLSWDFAEKVFYYLIFSIIGGRYFLALISWAKEAK